MEQEKKLQIEALLASGRQEGVYPGAVLLVSQGADIVYFESIGWRRLAPDPLPMERGTLFDLASLTKPLATTLAMMKLVDAGKVSLDQPLEALLRQTVPEDKKQITPRQLLSHSAGFVDWAPFYLELEHVPREKRKAALRDQLLNRPLAYPPGKQALYSDLGYMLLEWMIEIAAEMDPPRFIEETFYKPMSLEDTGFFSSHLSCRFSADRFAAAEDCPWRKGVIQGAVHDENAWAAGGYCGHAGLFGKAEEVYALTNLLREHWRGERKDYLSPQTVISFFARQDRVKGSTWALGWDTPSPENSSAGTLFSRDSVGHLGFTGTSIWMDLKQDVTVIFLTNRIHPTRTNEKIRPFRPLLHDRVMEMLHLGHSYPSIF